MPLVYGCIAPHGDEIVPELAGKRLAAKTFEGMKALSAELKRARPETIVVATPHNLKLVGSIGVSLAENSSGRWGTGRRSIELSTRCDTEFASELLLAGRAAHLPVTGMNYGTVSGPLSDLPMDWGALIPLWFFLKQNKLKSRIVIVSPSREIPLRRNYEFGALVATQAEAAEERVALIASADQAHTHDRRGPYGYSSEAAVFDASVLEAIGRDRLADVLMIPSSIVERARPDSLWQMAILAGALQKVRMRGRLYSYEVAGYFGMLCAGYVRAET